jgi:hypothetical protein
MPGICGNKNRVAYVQAQTCACSRKQTSIGGTSRLFAARREEKEKPKDYLGLKILWNSEIIHARWLDDGASARADEIIGQHFSRFYTEADIRRTCSAEAVAIRMSAKTPISDIALRKLFGWLLGGGV